jgi:integrase
MLKRCQVKSGVASFGFRDLKGKGATDMWLSGEPIERIQMLCGHATKNTTEIYIKARWVETAAPNVVKIGR